MDGRSCELLAFLIIPSPTLSLECEVVVVPPLAVVETEELGRLEVTASLGGEWSPGSLALCCVEQVYVYIITSKRAMDINSE